MVLRDRHSMFTYILSGDKTRAGLSFARSLHGCPFYEHLAAQTCAVILP